MYKFQIDRLVQERPNSIANTLELRLSCTKPSKCLFVIESERFTTENVLKSVSLELMDDKSTWDQVKAWCCKASHWQLIQCWLDPDLQHLMLSWGQNELTHWPVGDMNAILKIWFSILFYWLVSSYLLMIMPSDECHRTLLMIIQHWFR